MPSNPGEAPSQTSRSATQPEVSLRGGDVDQPSLALTVISHPCLGRIGEQALLTELERPGGRVEITRRSPLFAQPRREARRPLEDGFLSRRRPVVLTSTEDDGVHLDTSRPTGSVLVNGQATEELRLGRNDLERGVVLLLSRRVVLYLHVEKAAAPLHDDDFGLVGESAGIIKARNAIVDVSRSSHPVLIRGQSGTGKELVAQAIYARSKRKPFVPVSLATVPASLAAAELFGAEKGAYDGLREHRRGQFRQAHHGILFLDELGDVPLEIQPMLFRVLEDQVVRPLGTEKTFQVDVRFLAATDRDIEDAIARGQFRPQLFYRLRSHEILLPSLVERREDLGRLLVHLLTRELEACGQGHRLDLEAPDSPWLPAEMVNELMLYSWPGNVRELRDMARRLVAAAQRRHWRVDPRELLAEVDDFLRRAKAVPAEPTGLAAEPPLRQRRRLPAELRCEELVAALRQTDGSATRAAESLGVSRTSFYKQWQRCGLKTSKTVTDDELRAAFERCDGDVSRICRDLQVPKQGLFKRLKNLDLR